MTPSALKIQADLIAAIRATIHLSASAAYSSHTMQWHCWGITVDIATIGSLVTVKMSIEESASAQAYSAFKTVKAYLISRQRGSLPAFIAYREITISCDRDKVTL